jgi:hypothetical protein
MDSVAFYSLPTGGHDMKANVGNADRVIRIAAGILILSAVFVLEGNTRWFGLIGIVALATGFIRWCPAYSLLGTNTCGSESKTA